MKEGELSYAIRFWDALNAMAHHIQKVGRVTNVAEADSEIMNLQDMLTEADFILEKWSEYVDAQNEEEIGDEE